KDIPTSEAVSIINSDKKLDGVTLTDGDQVIKITENDDKKYRSYWVGNQSDQLVDKLNDRVQDKTLKSWQGENPGQSIWKALLINFLPFVIILLFFLWAMNAAQGMGGRGGVMGFGKSKAKV
ncbi:ATP-dependent zinc metalloprotease FtsH, partial [human gut metagenome]